MGFELHQRISGQAETRLFGAYCEETGRRWDTRQTEREKRGREKHVHLLCSGSSVLTALNGITLDARAAGISPVAL